MTKVQEAPTQGIKEIFVFILRDSLGREEILWIPHKDMKLLLVTTDRAKVKEFSVLAKAIAKKLKATYRVETFTLSDLLADDDGDVVD